MSDIDILLPAFNGDDFIGTQIESIQKQGYADWRLLIRDDGSTDETVAIIKDYALKDKRIFLVEAGKESLGVIKNITCLLEQSSAQYVMLCDQDDVWLPDKIEKSLDLMLRMEKDAPGFPLLVHGDLKVVDRSLKKIALSFWWFQHLDPANSGRINKLLVQNVATGCTMLMNRRLVELSLPIPESVLMHDWWIALVACALGKIGYILEPAVLYRQHGSNKIGGRGYGTHRILERLCSQEQVRSDFLGTIYQAQDFLQAYGPLMDKQTYDTVCRFSAILEQSRIIRVLDMLRYRFFKTGALRNMATAWILLNLPGDARNQQ